MRNYKINIIYNNTNDINDIFMKVLKKELQTYITRTYIKENKQTSSLNIISKEDRI